jgi:alkanesulfonate monooxygenase SsuD/methylene tetrahydromethanopterin reductase-like flavin-dependent oxidoreductase (luciferase family)
MDRLGIAFSGGANPAEIVDRVKLAENLGYESAWVAEGHGGDQSAVLSACAAQTSKILLGTSITSVFVRTAPTIAMAAATVDAISAGRFILGIGSSHRVQLEPEHGVPYGKPLRRVRKAVPVIRALLRDSRVSYQGETVRIEGFDLWFAPLRPAIPIYLSAVFPKMTTLCGEIADGVILTRSTLGTAAHVRERLAEGAKRAGRDRSKIVVSSLLPTAVASPARSARCVAAGARLLCRLLSPLQSHDNRARLSR